MTTYFTVPLPGLAPNPFVGSVVGATGSTFVPGVGQGSKLTLLDSPPRLTAPSFSPVFDGNAYTVVVTWSLFGQRYYVNCYDSASSLVFSVPLLETLEAQPIESLSWSPASLQVTATTFGPAWVPVGSVASLTVSGVSPSTYNGTFTASISSLDSFQYPMQSDPGTVTSAGEVSFLINMCAGYFNSTMIFRNGQFEVNP